MSPNTLLLPELREMLAENNVAEMKEFCTALHPASTADFLVGLTPKEIWEILKQVDVDTRANIFSYFDNDIQVQILESGTRTEIAEFIEHLPSDDRVDILDDVDPQVVEELMPLISSEEQEDIELLSSYPEDTCGSEMSTDFVRLRENMTVGEALNEISSQAPTFETVSYLYVLGTNDHLVGLISAKEFLRHISQPKTLLSSFMKTDLITVDVQESREEAVKLVAKYDFIALPVVDRKGVMLGIITHDDILDAAVHEMAENAHLSAAVDPLGDTTYLATNLFVLAQKRFMWLAILLFGALSTACILNAFESISEQIVWLVVFLPMIVSTGGNCGGQSATLVITALATNEITMSDCLRILRREFAMGTLLGIGMGFFGLINALIICGGSVPLSQLIIVPLAVFLVVFASNMTGAFLPLLFQRLGWDPALMSNPFVAGISDTMGTFIYMMLALYLIL
ncbi:MAG: magnesium transporter [Planctomycetia bacterium]|nr:magnesium transporter [Planctomycetia bacterium]